MDESCALSPYSKFQAWIATCAEAQHAISRHHACIMVTKDGLHDTLNRGPPPEKYDMYGSAWVHLVSARDDGSNDECECYTCIAISSLIPQAYSLLQGSGRTSIYNQTCPEMVPSLQSIHQSRCTVPEFGKGRIVKVIVVTSPLT